MKDIIKTLEQKEAEADALEKRLATLAIEIKLLKSLSGKETNVPADLQNSPSPSKIKTIAQRQQNIPNISLRDATLKGIRELGEFAKEDLCNWINKAYPNIGAKIKSLDKIIYSQIDQEKVKLLRPNFGSKRPAVYKWVGMNGEQ